MTRPSDATTHARRAAALVVGCVVFVAVGCVGVKPEPAVVRGQFPTTPPLPNAATLNALMKTAAVETVPPLDLPPPPPSSELPAVTVPELPPVPPGTLPPITLPDLPAKALPLLPPPEPAPPSAVPLIGPVRIGGAEVTLDQVNGWVNGGDAFLPTVNGGCATCGTAKCTDCEPLPRRGLPTKLVGALYDALCCPDPCYQPKWSPLQDSAFFVNSARPVTHTRLREEYTNEMKFPDRSEFYWARSDGNGKGVKPVGVAGIPRVDAHELSMYTETAAGPGFGAFVSMPYRSENPLFANPESSAGFSDLSLGTKSVLFDSDLALLTLQFKTTLPIGQPGKGLGTGHISLEPALLFGLRTSRDSYLQGEIAEWIPIAGDPTYSGALLHYHLSFNRTLWQPIPPVQLVGTLELSGYSLQDGGFTDPDGGFRKASGTNYLQAGGGLRLFFCDKYDFGVGTNFGVTGKNSLGQQLRAELRVRY